VDEQQYDSHAFFVAFQWKIQCYWMGVPKQRIPMHSSLCLSLLAAIMALLFCIKLRRLGDQSKCHNFDVNATLPIRGLLAILIVCHHIGQQFSDTPIGIFTSFGMTLVSVFFFISGYGLMISYRKKGKAYLRNFFQHRLSKLLPVFLTLTLACVAYSCVLKHHPLSEITHDLLQGNPPLPNSWFMYAIIYQYVVFYIACKLSHTQRQCIVISAIVTLISMVGMDLAHWGKWWWVSQPSFVIGMIIATCEEGLRKTLAKHTLVIAGALLLATSRLIRGFVGRLLFPNLMPILVLFMVYAYGTTSNRIAHYLGKISLEIYLIQGLAIIAVQHFNLSWCPFTICVFLLTLPAAAIAHWLGSKIASHF
jgi:peptidoglycan/LPS O-acetylase OafA/YrhL